MTYPFQLYTRLDYTLSYDDSDLFYIMARMMVFRYLKHINYFESQNENSACPDESIELMFRHANVFTFIADYASLHTGLLEVYFLGVT